MSRDYPDNGYPSVTETIGVLRKIGLEMWFKFNTAKFCNDASNKGKLIGTQIHDGIESYITTGEAKVESEYGDEVTNALKSFMLFHRENPDMKLELSELSLTSNIHKFNGTIDCVSGDVILDWKTGNAKEETQPKIYDEWKYQVAAYSYLYREIKGVDIQSAIIVAIAKDKIAYSLYKMDKQEIDDCFNRVFLPALSICNYQKEVKQKLKEERKRIKKEKKDAILNANG